MSEVIQKAKNLATEKHAHLHLHDAEKTPVIDHISEVASLVERNGGTEDMIVAAWLHDIVEDTDITLKDIEDLFGANVALLVDGLTDPAHFESLPLNIRKPLQAERIKEKNDQIKRIKICDQLSNVARLVNNPPQDWGYETMSLYVHGARAVTDACRGVCVELDELFDEVYRQACAKYGNK